jgi:hypothetical protein
MEYHRKFIKPLFSFINEKKLKKLSTGNIWLEYQFSKSASSSVTLLIKRVEYE